MNTRILLLATTVVCSAALPAHSATTFLAMKSPGGIEFWYQARPDLPKSTVVAGWRDGLGYALPGKQSLSKIAPALMERGAGERSANELSEAMDDFGADSNLTSDGWRAYATLTAAPDKLAGAALIEHDILAAPLLEARELERIRKALVDRNRENSSKAEAIATRAALRYAYGDSVWTRGFDATTFDGITREDVVQWSKRVLARDNMVISASGSLSGAEFGVIVDSIFKDMPEKSDVPAMAEPIFQPAPKTIVVESDQAQTVLLEMAPTSIDSDRNRLKSALGLEVFGGNTESRLFRKVRGELGAAYGIDASLAGRTRRDILLIHAAVSHDKASAALAAIAAEYALWQEKGISSEEFAAARSQLSASFGENANEPGADAQQFVTAMLTGRPPNDPFDYADRLASYTPEIINADIASRFPAKSFVTLIVTPDASKFAGDCVIKDWHAADTCR